MASPDLTKNIGRNDRPIMGVDGKAPMASKHDGAASFSNIVTIGESPVVPGLLWVGTNDGNLQVSRDGGATWKNVVDRVPGVPKETHVSRVEPSHFDAGTCYVTFDGHRTDDMKPYVFVTRDFGETWTSIAANLPDGNVNVITEDPRNKNLLFLGTEYAVYVSLDGGKEWKRFTTGLPTVRIDDIIVHPARARSDPRHARPQHLDPRRHHAAGATGRRRDEGGCVSVRRPAGHRVDQRHPEAGAGGRGEGTTAGAIPPRERRSSYWLAKPASSVKISISDVTGREVRSIDGSKDAGINRVQWDLRANPPARGTPPAAPDAPAPRKPIRPRRAVRDRDARISRRQLRPPEAVRSGARTTRARSRTRGPTARRRRWSRSRQRRAPTAGRVLPAEAERRWQDDRDEDGGHRGR